MIESSESGASACRRGDLGWLAFGFWLLVAAVGFGAGESDPAAEVTCGVDIARLERLGICCPIKPFKI